MKKTITVEGHSCDVCGAEGYVATCMHCGAEHCWECRKTEGKEYSHLVYASGSGDGYYCNACDAELTKTRKDKRHTAYRAVAALRLEAKGWGEDFEIRRKDAEIALEALRHNAKLTSGAHTAHETEK